MDDSCVVPATSLAAVLAAWGIDASGVEVAPLPVAGLSGSPVRLVQRHGSADAAVLKAFAGGTPRARAEWVHALVAHLVRAGIEAVPDLRVARDGHTVVTDPGGRHWELVRFVPGCATDAPSAAQAAAAATVLARLHVAAATLPTAASTRGPSPGVAHRIERAGALLARPWHVRPMAHAPAAIADRLGRAIEAFARHDGVAALAAVARTDPPKVMLQAVLRDVWSDHVLYAYEQPDRVAGIVDYHAAAIDTPATDLARLLGSWRPSPGGTGGDRWSTALAAYDSERSLDAVERRLVPWLHATGVVFGLDNWFRWTLDEPRRFASPAAVLARIDHLSSQLPAALESLRPGPCNPV